MQPMAPSAHRGPSWTPCATTAPVAGDAWGGGAGRSDPVPGSQPQDARVWSRRQRCRAAVRGCSEVHGPTLPGRPFAPRPLLPRTCLHTRERPEPLGGRLSGRPTPPADAGRAGDGSLRLPPFEPGAAPRALALPNPSPGPFGSRRVPNRGLCPDQPTAGGSHPGAARRCRLPSAHRS